jgi:hypothetical protein
MAKAWAAHSYIRPVARYNRCDRRRLDAVLFVPVAGDLIWAAYI